MIPTHILKKVRRVQITTAKKATDIFAGEYKSIFKGRGMEFFEVREYLPGDEIRAIDWNVTARMGTPFIKKHIEERELTIMLLLDISRSNMFGSVNRLKRDLAAEVAAVLAASATKNNDKVGLVMFTDKVELFLPPRKGTSHVFRVIRAALYQKAEGKGTDIPAALRYLDKVVKKSAVVFLISDYFDKNLDKALSIANKKHDLVAVTVTDPRELAMPNVGVIKLDDAENGRAVTVDTSSARFRDEYREKSSENFESRKKLFYKVNVDQVAVNTEEPYEEALVRFFSRRKLRK